MEGVDGATLRNVEAAKGLAGIVCTSLGPNGMNKLVINHLEKIIVTSDCATIVKELEIQHPAAKMLELAAEMQEQECGDATNLTVSFAGELLKMCEDLLRMGLHTSEIVMGYKRAYEFLEKALPTLVTETVKDCRDVKEMIRIVTPVLAAKQFGFESVLAPLVVSACQGTFSSNGRAAVNSDSVRIAKIMGGNVSQSEVIQGMVIMRGTEGSIQHKDAAKISVFACGLEASATEAKGTVLMKNADDLMSYNKSEEKKVRTCEERSEELMKRVCRVERAHRQRFCTYNTAAADFTTIPNAINTSSFATRFARRRWTRSSRPLLTPAPR